MSKINNLLALLGKDEKKFVKELLIEFAFELLFWGLEIAFDSFGIDCETFRLICIIACQFNL